MHQNDDWLTECLRRYKPDEVETETITDGQALHRLYHQQIEEVDAIDKTWLEKAGLKDSKEALTMAAQEQALTTKSVESRLYHTRQDTGCRLCKDAPEKVQHITTGCKMQVPHT